MSFFAISVNLFDPDSDRGNASKCVETSVKQDAYHDEDFDLVRRIAGGDRSAMRDLFTRHHGRIFRFITRQAGSQTLADDVANEVFIEVWRAASSFEGRSKVTTWLFSIARFKTLSALRKRTTETLDDDASERIEDDADTPEVSAQKSSKANALRNAVNSLQEEHRTVIDLIYYHEKPVREVAEILAIPEATVKTRMFYARRKIGEILNAAGIDRGWP